METYMMKIKRTHNKLKKMKYLFKSGFLLPGRSKCNWNGLWNATDRCKVLVFMWSMHVYSAIQCGVYTHLYPYVDCIHCIQPVIELHTPAFSRMQLSV